MIRTSTYDDAKWKLVPVVATDEMLRAAMAEAERHLLGYWSNAECTTDEERADKSNAEYWSAMLSAAPEHEDEGGWLPISEAPMDGSLVTLGSAHGVWVGKYVPIFASGYRPKNPWASLLLNHDHIPEPSGAPTHFRPLPPAPKGMG